MKIPYMMFCIMLTLFLAETEVSMSDKVNCNAMELIPCADALASSNPPTAVRRGKLKDQQPYFSEYMDDPTDLKNCNAMELIPCADAVASSTPPTAECCGKMKEQQPCFCEYMTDPAVDKFFNTPNFNRVAQSCGSPKPSETDCYVLPLLP